MAQMIQILLFLGVPFLERSKITVWERHLLKKRIYYRSFEFSPALCKKVFLKHKWSAFLFMAHITQILLFSGMLLLERSKIIVWQRHLFKKNCYGSFRYVSTYVKRCFQEHQWAASLFIAQITQILLLSGMLPLERSKLAV